LFLLIKNNIFIKKQNDMMSKKISNLESKTFVDVDPEKIFMTPEGVSPKKNKGCSSCKQKGLNYNQWFMVILGFYILFSAIYGTIELVKLLF
jgi:hypothetical protein